MQKEARARGGRFECHELMGKTHAAGAALKDRKRLFDAVACEIPERDQVRAKTHEPLTRRDTRELAGDQRPCPMSA